VRGAFLAMSLALLGMASRLEADVSTYANASSGGLWLNVQSDPRAVAMAGAGNAVATELPSLESNPAGLSALQGLQANLAHNFWVLDLSQEHLAAGLPLGPGMGSALSLDYMDLGSVDSYGIGTNGQPVSLGTLHPYAFDLSLGLGKDVGQGLSLGASLKLLGEHLDSSSGYAGALDLGCQWLTPLQGLDLGLSMRNLGTQLEGASLPLNVDGGFSYAIPMGMPKAALALMADLSTGLVDNQGPVFSLGEEFSPTRLLALRAGYQFGNTQLPSGFTAGLGLRQGWFRLDYAYDARGSLGGAQQLALTLDLGPAPAKAAGPSPTPTPEENQDDYHSVVDAINAKDYTRAQAMASQLNQAQQDNLKRTYEAYISPKVYIGDMDAAEQIAKILVQLDPGNAEYQERLGIIQWHLGKQAEADEHLKKAMALDPSRTYLKENLSKP
jgi:tetratricopeptide (TPR) repeat protein